MRVEHLLHLRCEVSAPDIVENFERHAIDPLVALVSVMNHTPGQRQWRDLGKYRQYTERNGSLRETEYTELEHVELAREVKVAISEFPTTVHAAQAARAAGMAIVMGGPNLVKGGWHSGNVSAADLAERGLLDILSRNPARAIGYRDRGEIAPEQRADIVRVKEVGGMPVVRGTWWKGVRAA